MTSSGTTIIITKIIAGLQKILCSEYKQVKYSNLFFDFQLNH
jgi:hypothetical protein